MVAEQGNAPTAEGPDIDTEVMHAEAARLRETPAVTLELSAAGTNEARWREELGKNLRRLREERNMSVRQLAGEARMYWIELERYEDASQVPTLDRVYAIASCLDVTIHDLLPPNA